MAEPEPKELWFVRRRVGRSSVVHWKGGAAFVALLAAAGTGAAADSIRDRHPVLAVVAMVGLGVTALALVFLINKHTGDREPDRDQA